MNSSDLQQPSQRRPQVTVIGDSQAAELALAVAEQVGEMLGHLGCTVITGGGKGIMEAVCRGARRAGSMTIGILPGHDIHAGNPFLDVVIPSGIGYARNMANVLAADVVVAIGGAAGTLSEMAYAWMHGKPIIAMAGTGGWADRLANDRIDNRRSDVIEKAETMAHLEQLVSAKLKEQGFALC